MMRVKLRNLRTEKGMTIEEVAAALNTSRSHYGQIESGEKNPSLGLALAIKKFFECDDDDIFLPLNAPERNKN